MYTFVREKVVEKENRYKRNIEMIIHTKMFLNIY